MADSIVEMFGGNTSDNPLVSAAVEDTCEYAVHLSGGSVGAITNPSPTGPSAAADGCLIYGNYGEIYFRVWAIPAFLNPINPGRNVPIPFLLWNAYTVKNYLNTVGGTGQTGLTTDIVVSETFEPVEEREFNITIEDDAPFSISATYIFTFTYNSVTMLFEVVVINWLEEIPDFPVLEQWEWLTDVIRTADGSEQRISIRNQPRRRLEGMILIKDDVDREEQLRRWYELMEATTVIPFYQYATRITQDSVITDTKIYFDPAKTDVRAGEKVIIYHPQDDTSFPLELTAMAADGATLDPLTYNVYAGDLIAPAFDCHLDNRTGVQMTQVAGQLRLRAQTAEYRDDFDRPGSTATITTYDSLDVMDRIPLASRGFVDEIVDMGPAIIDNESGVIDRSSPWLHASVDGVRKWIFNRKTNPTEMDWWRDFLTARHGMRVSFLMPTWREDLFLDTDPSAGVLQFDVEGLDYHNRYSEFDTYKRLQLINPDGDIIYRTVDYTTSSPGGITTITLTSAMPVDSSWENGFTISFLHRVRLNSDRVRLTHGPMDTEIELSIRTVDA